MDPAALRAALAAGDGPTIVCAQAGDVNSGAFDPLDEVRRRGARARARGSTSTAPSGCGPRPARATATLARRAYAGADSWATDAHKWLNVPYDCGLAFVAHPEPHRGGDGVSAAYLPRAHARRARRIRWTPDFSRRGRAFAVYAALRSLGRDGVAELVERCCACARRFAEVLGAQDGVEVLNDVVLNQVLVRFGDDDAAHRRRGRRGAGRGHAAGWARRRGAGGAPCGSRSPTGRRRSATSIARARRSSPRRARSDGAAGRSRVARCTRATC